MKNRFFLQGVLSNGVMDSVSLQEIQSQLNTLKNKLTPTVINYIIVLAVLSLPISLYRTVETDWHGVSTVLHCSIFVFAVALYLWRYHVDHKVVIFYLLYAGLVFTSTEFLAFGIMGIGELSAAFTVMLSLFYLDRRITILVALIASAFYFIAMNDYVLQQQAYILPAEDILRSPVNWIAIYFNACVFVFFIGICTECVHKKMIGLGNALREKSLKIEEQNKKIEYLANHDQLTGLPSLRLAGDQLQQAMDEAQECGHKAALLFMDLDGFKKINDTLGHEAGDELLKTVADRVRDTLSEHDSACRVGGDEFLIIIHTVHSEESLKKTCADLIEAISAPVRYQETFVTVGASIGAAVYPICADNTNDLRAKADKLMYQVKKSGKNNYKLGSQAAVCESQVAYG